MFKPVTTAIFDNSVFAWRSLSDDNLEEYIMNIGGFHAIAMHCGKNTFYIRGSFGEIGGEIAVSLEDAEQFLLSQMKPLHDFLIDYNLKD